MSSLAMEDEIERMSEQLRLRVNISAGDSLVTETPPVLEAPRWALNVTLQGQRDYAHIFRLPLKGGWIQKWVYSRGAETELIPEAALENSTTESTTVFRMIPQSSVVLPMMSTHWFLCPYQSCNGYTVGLAYMDTTLDRLDTYSVHPMPCGRFAMDEATGEVFMTAWHDKLLTVAWTESVSGCERVRELFVFEAPKTEGTPPGRLLLRNSFYERRDCRLCSAGRALPPCRSPAARARSVSRAQASDYLFPLQTTYRRFRGCFFGVVVKTVYNYARATSGSSAPGEVIAVVPIVCDIRHGVASVARRLRINLRQSAVSFGVDPRVSQRMLMLDARRSITAKLEAALDSGGEGSGNASSETSACSNGEAKRRRNADNVHDRDSIVHLRKVRNRVSAAKTNEARKRRIQANKAELEELKTSKVPNLVLRLQQLRYENKRLKEQVSAQRAAQRMLPDECVDADGGIPLTGGPLAAGPFDFSDDILWR